MQRYEYFLVTSDATTDTDVALSALHKSLDMLDHSIGASMAILQCSLSVGLLMRLCAIHDIFWLRSMSGSFHLVTRNRAGMP